MNTEVSEKSESAEDDSDKQQTVVEDEKQDETV